MHQLLAQGHVDAVTRCWCWIPMFPMMTTEWGDTPVLHSSELPAPTKPRSKSENYCISVKWQHTPTITDGMFSSISHWAFASSLNNWHNQCRLKYEFICKSCLLHIQCVFFTAVLAQVVASHLSLHFLSQYQSNWSKTPEKNSLLRR